MYLIILLFAFSTVLAMESGNILSLSEETNEKKTVADKNIMNEVLAKVCSFIEQAQSNEDAIMQQHIDTAIAKRNELKILLKNLKQVKENNGLQFKNLIKEMESHKKSQESPIITLQKAKKTFKQSDIDICSLTTETQPCPLHKDHNRTLLLGQNSVEALQNAIAQIDPDFLESSDEESDTDEC